MQPGSTGPLLSGEAQAAGPCTAGRDALRLLSRPFLSPHIPQEAVEICFVAGFDHLPVVWFLSSSSLGGFNYLN